MLSLLNQPCTSRFASAIQAGLSTRPAVSRRRTFRWSARNSQVDRQKAVEAASENIELGEPAAYISTSSDPWFNLSYEDWQVHLCIPMLLSRPRLYQLISRLLRNSPRNQPTLFLYRNDPCVVLGRNQNPWQESTPRRLLEWEIPLIRRRSGGGTVFHDQGNTNFSIILPRLLFTRSHGANLVARAVRERLGVQECTVNERNDVTIRDEVKGKDFKQEVYLSHIGRADGEVSGSAYKIIQRRAYHHGTMLISSDLSSLGKALRSSSPNIVGKSVASVRSPVSTLNTYLPSHLPRITHDSFVQAIVDEFASFYCHSSSSSLQSINVDEQSLTDAQRSTVQVGMEELKSWEWTFGQTPEFSNDIEGDLSFGSISANITARHAVITAASLHYAPPVTASTDNQDREHEHAIQAQMDDLALRLVGQRYETLDHVPSRTRDGAGRRSLQNSRETEVLDWLRANM